MRAPMYILVPMLWACASEPPAQGVSLSRDVVPILHKHGCAATGCHSDSSDARAHETDFRTAASTYISLLNHRSRQHCAEGSDAGINTPFPGKFRVTPGDPSQSFLLDKLRDPRESCGIFYGRMPPPPAAPVPSAEVDVVERWIVEGALNN